MVFIVLVLYVVTIYHVVFFQKFEAYDSNGVPIAGDKTKEVYSLLSNIWMFDSQTFC